MPLLEAGKIINTHGVKGEVKIENYCDDAEFFKKIETVYIQNTPHKILAQRPHKGFILAMLEGVDTIEAAIAMKNKVLYFEREAVKLPKGSYFLSDILGFGVFDARLDCVIGTLKRVDELPASQVYVVETPDGEVLIPAVKAFVSGIDFEKKQVNIATIYGMMPNEN